ncbi:uncharacterized protein LOC121846689 [Oncorhynchus tshawytscha]|uniref:Uncharacterized protein n=1 Tax=Oncorhynchus tshawytscha TaxID=74940 RepID=A0AAZ3QGX4_ONCTS|nr:uncharacterized protein LOC121846689 [Oncorhynchus tshawytscha]
MNSHYFYTYTSPRPASTHHFYRSMCPTVITPPMQWPNNYSLYPPCIPTKYQFPLNLVSRSTRGFQGSDPSAFHHYHQTSPLPWCNYRLMSNPYWHYHQRLYANLSAPVAPVAPTPTRLQRFQNQGGTWPEGFTLRGELRWGRLKRVYGPRRELLEIVREDLRRVYGTYPRTDVSITYQGGEYVVRGDTHVGEQEYRVERRIVRQQESPEGESMSEVVEKRRKMR